VVDAEATTKHTRNQRGTYEGNATVSMKEMQQYQQYRCMNEKERCNKIGTYHERELRNLHKHERINEAARNLHRHGREAQM